MSLAPDLPKWVENDVFLARLRISRETVERLRVYAETLARWRSTINLVGASTIPDLWTRHILDSVQLWPLIQEGAGTLVDVGSGAGFPGLALALCGDMDVHLIESNQRKCAFLREAARLTGAKVAIHPRRIERVAPFTADVMTARAVAPLARLLELSQPFVGAQTVCLFPKGRRGEAELTETRKLWSFQCVKHPSVTDSTATLLRLSEVRREQHSQDHRPRQSERRRGKDHHGH